MIAHASITPFITASPMSTYQVRVCMISHVTWSPVSWKHVWVHVMNMIRDRRLHLHIVFINVSVCEESTVSGFSCCSDGHIAQEILLTNERKWEGERCCQMRKRAVIHHSQTDLSVSEQRNIVFCSVCSHQTQICTTNQATLLKWNNSYLWTPSY